MDANKPPVVEPGDIALVAVNKPERSAHSAWVPAEEVGRIQEKLEACQDRLRDFAHRLKAIGEALYSGNAKPEDFDSKFST